MRTEEEIYDMIEFYKEALNDHHLWLNEPVVRNALVAIYETAINTLQWVLNEPKPTKEEESVE